MIRMIRDAWEDLKFRLTDPVGGVVPLWVVLLAVSLMAMAFVSFVVPMMVKQITHGMVFLVWFLSFLLAALSWLAVKMIGELRFRSFLAAQNRPPANDEE